MASLQDVERRVNRIENTLWVAAALAVIFGLTGGWGIKLISNANSDIDHLNDRITKLAEDIAKHENLAKAALVEQQDVSIAKIKTAGAEIVINQLQRAEIVLDGKPIERPCTPATRDATSPCQCRPGEINLGVINYDFPGDGKQYERVSGILCGKLKVRFK